MPSSRAMEDASDEHLVELSKAGDDDAFAQLLARYVPFIQHKSARFREKGLDRDDLAQEGAIGLLNAVRHYDYTKAASFKTFASVCIERKILTAFRMFVGKKHQPLNESVSLDADGGSLDTQISSGMIMDPEMHLIHQEGYQSMTCLMEEILSSKEHQVFRLYLSGRSYGEIAKEIGLSEKSVDNALQRIRRKMRVAVSGTGKTVTVQKGNGVN